MGHRCSQEISSCQRPWTDISDEQFPHPSTLPKELRFAKYSFFESVPSNLVGVFDVAHMTFVTPALFNGGRDTVIEHVEQLLKPGGWVQWQEPINPTMQVVDLKTGEITTQNPAEDWMEKRISYMSAQDWTAEMPKVLSEVGGFVETDMDVVKLDKKLLNLETQLLMWNTEQVLPSAAKRFGTEKDIREAEEAVGQTRDLVKSGKLFHWRFMVGFGKKPE